MPTEDLPEEVRYREDTTEEYSFDDLAKGLASGAFSRSRVLKLLGGATLAGALSFLAWPKGAEARKRKKKRGGGGGAASVCPAGTSFCVQASAGATNGSAQITCCPVGTKCCQSAGLGGGVTCCRANSLVDTCGGLLAILPPICLPGCIPDVDLSVLGLVNVGENSCQVP